LENLAYANRNRQEREREQNGWTTCVHKQRTRVGDNVVDNGRPTHTTLEEMAVPTTMDSPAGAW
jgi:hypothetical protein